jgi:hypothetical protein
MSRSPRARHLAPLLLLVAACGRLSDDRAVALVRHYNQQNIEAFRTGDARITEPYTGIEEGKKLLGLIGVRLDQGRTLDAELLEFEPLGVSREGDAVLVRTRERWHWLERKIGTGQPLGLDSTDRYLMTYRLEKVDGAWVVAGTEFTEPPVIGRPWSNWDTSPRDLHGNPAKSGTTGAPPAAGGAPGGTGP